MCALSFSRFFLFAPNFYLCSGGATCLASLVCYPIYFSLDNIRIFFFTFSSSSFLLTSFFLVVLFCVNCRVCAPLIFCAINNVIYVVHVQYTQLCTMWMSDWINLLLNSFPECVGLAARSLATILHSNTFQINITVKIIYKYYVIFNIQQINWRQKQLIREAHKWWQWGTLLNSSYEMLCNVFKTIDPYKIRWSHNYNGQFIASHSKIRSKKTNKQIRVFIGMFVRCLIHSFVHLFVSFCVTVACVSSSWWWRQPYTRIRRENVMWQKQ